jgi:hypothetical protein
MDLTMLLGQLGSALGRGLLAGLAGIAAMTAGQLIEMRLTVREPSSAPGDAAAKVLGIRLATKAEQLRFSNVVHWLYGTAWGMVRGLLGLAGLSGWLATGAHFMLVWVTALLILPGLKVTPPVREWGAKWIAIDAFHHAVYAVAVGLVYDWIS